MLLLRVADILAPLSLTVFLALLVLESELENWSHAGSAYLLIGALGSPYYLHEGGYILWSFVLPVVCLLANIT